MHRNSGAAQMISGANNSGCVGSSNLNTGSLDSLPKQFIASMKTLFDIMDDDRVGFVKLSDIETRWQDDGCKGLPHGVIDSLRKVTPVNGLLTFERFCTGLKICLLRNQSFESDHHSRASSDNGVLSIAPLRPLRPPSAPLLDIGNPLPNASWTSNNTATVRPNNALSPCLPQLSRENDFDTISENILTPSDIYDPPPPKPPRTAVQNTNNGMDKAEIRHALQNWQMGVLMSQMDLKDMRKSFPSSVTGSKMTRGTADGGSIEGGQLQQPQQESHSQVGTYQKKATVKRREPRRHTLQNNGIDYNMLKRLKQFEEEKEVILLGLASVEEARDWYLLQISNIQEKIKYLGQMGHWEQWSETQQERLDLQKARIVEVNRHLSALVANSWERGGYPLHINLALRPYTQREHQIHQQQPKIQTGVSGGDAVTRLKHQNRQLNDEIGQKTERITALEREKQSLIRDLLQLQQYLANTAGGILSLGLGKNCSNSASLSDVDVY